MKDNQITSVFHYIPLHSSDAGIKFGRFDGEDIYTTKESERLTRLPMNYAMTVDEAQEVVDRIIDFYKGK